jgi:hypothetical protein
MALQEAAILLKVSAQSKRDLLSAMGLKASRINVEGSRTRDTFSSPVHFQPRVRKTRPEQDPAMFFADGWWQDFCVPR